MSENGETKRTVLLAAEADDNGVIDGKMGRGPYENVVIRGPAIIAPLSHVTLEHNRFDGNPEALFLELPERPVIGVIALQNVTFRNCQFVLIGIAGTKESVAMFKRGFGVR